MLGRRENPGEHEAMRKMKNEFMVNWDGLRTKDTERVLVLAATNRPFDLDEAVIRRLPRRYEFFETGGNHPLAVFHFEEVDNYVCLVFLIC